MGAVGGYAVGLVPHEGAVNLGWLMLGLGSVALAAQVVLNRRRVVKPAPVRSATDT
jgi:DHA1 family bicyclomycin/chloramphenicol resistance-like MFS transporter